MLRHRVFLAGFLVSGLAVGRTHAQPGAVVGRSEVETLVRHYYEEVAGQDEQEKSHAAVDHLLSAEFTFTFGNQSVQTRGIDAYKNWLTWHHSVAKNQEWRIENLVIQDDAAAVRFHLTVTASGPVLGVRADGQTVTLRGMDLFRISGGRIVELYRVFDVRDLLRQLGATCPCKPSG